LSAAIELQKQLYARLTSNTALLDLLGSPAIFDDVPNGQKPPYLTFGESRHSPWSTGTEEGTEHIITLDVWSDLDGRKQLFEITGAVGTALEGFNVPLEGHVLVNFHATETTIIRNVDAGLFQAEVNFRAVTEPVVI